MSTLVYDALSGHMPRRPANSRISLVRFDSCPGTTFRIYIHSVIGNHNVDEFGMSENSWWIIECDSLPIRAVRLYMGSRSMSEFLRRYGFTDPGGCLNHKHVRLKYTPDSYPIKATPPSWIPSCVVESMGIPQFYPRSGNCWFAAMCGTSFMSNDVRQILEAHVQNEELRTCFKGCNFDRNTAERLRKRLWYDFAVGDNVENPPELDGRNGFAEFSTMCAKIGAPMHRYKERKGELLEMDDRVIDQRNKTHRLRKPNKNEEHILALRFQDGDHVNKFPVQRRLRIGSQYYKLCGFYAGQKKCGHQLGIVSPTGNWRDWVILDADLHKDGISPIFVRFEGPEWITGKWWDAWEHLIHVTKFGHGTSELCNLSPWNPNNESLDKFRGANKRPGTNSLDILYASIPMNKIHVSPTYRAVQKKTRSNKNKR